MDWDDLRFFLAVSRKGSIRGGANQLGLSHSTVSRRINAFEQKLNIRLFERLATGYVLTAAGEDMLGAVERMDNEVDALDRKIFSRESGLKGSLRITLSQYLADYLLMPNFAAFTQKYPDIELDIDVSEPDFNLSKREADIAIRISEGPPEHLVGRKVARYQNGFYSSLDYLKRIRKKSLVSWIGWSDEAYNKRVLAEAGSSDIKVQHQINQMITQYYAAKAGMGVVKIACFIGDRDPELTRVPPGLSKHTWDIWILTHQDLRYSARVRVFMDFMVEVFEEHRDLIEGLRPQPHSFTK